MSACSRPARSSAARFRGPRGSAPRTARHPDGRVLMTTAARGHRPRLQLEDLRAAAHRELLAEVARKFGEIRFKATGDSMLPSVWPGDLLTVRQQSFSEFQSGEIVLYEREAGENTLTRPYGPASPGGRGFVAHRIVGRRGRQLITRGDSLRRNDAPVDEEQVLGRVVCVTRNGRRIGLEFTRKRRMAAWVLRRSDLAGRVLLRFARMKVGTN